MSDVVIEVLKNGPLWVETVGDFALTDHEGNAIAVPEGKKGVALCRCGQSSNKPFCDGAHKAAEFNGD
jgi:CDGSH-type Zn-finger protein